MTLRRISIVMVAVVMAWVCPHLAEAAAEKESTDSGVPLPVIARGEGENCVADTQFMRHNHMTMLKIGRASCRERV